MKYLDKIVLFVLDSSLNQRKCKCNRTREYVLLLAAGIGNISTGIIRIKGRLT